MHGTLLTTVDVGATGALLRVVVAGAFAITLHRLWPDAGLPAAALALAVLLFAVKAFAAVARKLLPLPPRARAHQDWRRNLARFHDSYQVRKLLWFGLGILAATAAMPARWGIPLGAGCALGGAAAEVVWRRKRLPLAPPPALVRA